MRFTAELFMIAFTGLILLRSVSKQTCSMRILQFYTLLQAYTLPLQLDPVRAKDPTDAKSTCQEVAFELYSFVFASSSGISCVDACKDIFKDLEGSIGLGFGQRTKRPKVSGRMYITAEPIVRFGKVSGLTEAIDWIDACMYAGRLCLSFQEAEILNELMLKNPLIAIHVRLTLACAESRCSSSSSSSKSCRSKRILKLLRVYEGSIKLPGHGFRTSCDPDDICHRMQDRLNRIKWACYGQVKVRDVRCDTWSITREGYAWCPCNENVKGTISCQPITLPFILVSRVVNFGLIPTEALAAYNLAYKEWRRDYLQALAGLKQEQSNFDTINRLQLQAIDFRERRDIFQPLEQLGSYLTAEVITSHVESDYETMHTTMLLDQTGATPFSLGSLNEYVLEESSMDQNEMTCDVSVGSTTLCELEDWPLTL